MCTKDPPCKFCGICSNCGEVHEENSWIRYFGEYFNNSHFWRTDLRGESEMMSRFPWHLKMRGRCRSTPSQCLFCGICIGCAEEYTKQYGNRNSWWRMWGFLINFVFN